MNRIKDSFGAADDLESLAKKMELKYIQHKLDLVVGMVFCRFWDLLTLYIKNLLISDKTPDSFLSKYNKSYQGGALLAGETER